MQKVLAVYKPIGLTPLETINLLRESDPNFIQLKISYAGRLDPLAHGVLLLMLGEETKNRHKYLSLAKKYEFTVCFGLRTDTYDILGLLQNKSVQQPGKNVNIFVNNFVNKYRGKMVMDYPPFSSKPVNGKPLFWWARNKKLHEITVPKHAIEIFEFHCLSTGEIDLRTVKQKTDAAIKSVHGDFRQEEIREQWSKFFSGTDDNFKFITATFSISCSSGTYIRELVNMMGQEFECGALAIDILRTEVGEFSLKDVKHITS